MINLIKTIVAVLAVAGLVLCVSGDARLALLGVLLLGGVAALCGMLPDILREE